MIIFAFTILLATLIASAAGEMALSAILGVVGSFLTQFIKRYTGTSGNVALILTIVVSGVLGFVSAYSVGEWDGGDIVGSSAIVFSLATIAYRFFLSNDAVTDEPVVADNDGNGMV